MRLAIFAAILAGVALATQATFSSAAQRSLGPTTLVALSGLTTGIVGLGFSLFVSRPEWTVRAVFYCVVSGTLGAVVLGGIAFAAGHGGVARTLSLVIASQLLVGLVLDRFGLLGANAQGLGLLKMLGVLLILVGGVLVVRY